MSRLIVVQLCAAVCVTLVVGACAKQPASTVPGNRTREAARPRPDGPRYLLRLHRPDRVGQRFRNIRKGTKLTAFTVDGQRVESLTKASQYACDGVETIQAVTHRGMARKVSYRVNYVRVTRGKKTRDLLPQGTVVEADSVRGDKRYTVNSKPVAAEALTILLSCFEFTDVNHVTDDDYLGTAGARRVGDSWPVNKVKHLEAMNHELKGLVLNPRPRDVIGRVALLGPARMAGVTALRYRASIQTKNFAPSMGPVRPTRGSMRIVIEGWVSRDPRAQARGRRLTMSSHFEGALTRDGELRTLVVDYLHTRVERRLLIR